MQVVNGRELGSRARSRALAVEIGGAVRVPGVVDAVGRHEPLDEVGNRLRQIGLFVAHRRRIVDIEEEVHLVDGRRLNLRSEARFRDRIARFDRSREATVRDAENRTHHGAESGARNDPRHRSLQGCRARPVGLATNHSCPGAREIVA